MGHKIHPTGFRVGVIYGWQSKWYSDRGYTRLLHEDLAVRRKIMTQLADASISRVDIDRSANQVTITIHTAKPGIVIGRQGAKVEELRQTLDKLTGRRVRVNIQEIRVPELDAYLVARSIADQLQRRIAFRRAMKQAVQRTMQRGAKGIKVIVAGRLGGAEMSRRETEKDGRVPLHTLRADIDYGLAEAHTTFGRIGVKVWIYKGEILPEPKQQRPEAEEMAAAEAAAVPAAAVAPEPPAAATVAAQEPAVQPPVPAVAAAPEPAPAAAPAPAEAVTAAPAAPAADPMAELQRMQEEMRRMQEEMARLQRQAAEAVQQQGAPPAAGEPAPPETTPEEKPTASDESLEAERENPPGE
ncbi:MAG TPA: 30S ribosomal protein S3 [Dehalococcoidia bacterium]|nr:30S ribosomal protein S3 [Dehalococcoidia bacterium]